MQQNTNQRQQNITNYKKIKLNTTKENNTRKDDKRDQQTTNDNKIL